MYWRKGASTRQRRAYNLTRLLDLPDADDVVRVAGEERLAIGRPRHRQTLRGLGVLLRVCRNNISLELVNLDHTRITVMLENF